MFATTPATDYVARRPTRRDPSLSPSFVHRTPPRLPPLRKSHRSPSPLKRHTLPVASMDDDDVFSSPAPVPFTRRENTPGRKPGLFDADDDGLLLAVPSSAQSRALFPPSSSPMPLRTPVKQTPISFQTPARPVLSVRQTNTAAAGTKRKPTPSAFISPEQKCILTPLNITSGDSGDEGFGFNRLAPLSAPRFTARTPQTKKDTEQHLKKQADSMKKLKLIDQIQSGEESGYDSGAEAREDEGMALFAAPPTTAKSKAKKSPGLALRVGKGLSNDDEVVESLSPGGHVNKRRARSRPVSTELLRSVATTPAPSKKMDYVPTPIFSTKKASVAFPSYTGMRSRRTSGSSSSSVEVGSPRRRTRMPSRPRTQSQNPRALNRLTSHSSATLFFGPSIPQTEARPKTRAIGAESHVPESPVPVPGRPQNRTRHSYAGEHWRSPRKSSDMDEADLFFSSPPANANASFAFDLTGTPSPSKKRRLDVGMDVLVELLPTKYRPRDSGVVLDVDDSDDELFGRSTGASASAGGLCRTENGNSSSSFGSLLSQEESDREALVTPGLLPGPSSGWPGVSIVNPENDNDNDSYLSTQHAHPHLSDVDNEDEVDAFILRTLTTGTNPSSSSSTSRIPGTPVKKVKTSHLLERPWQSAVAAHKIGFPEFDVPLAPKVGVTGKENNRKGKGKEGGKGKPRQSLPAAFPALALGSASVRPARRTGLSVDLEEGDEEASPTTRKEGRFGYDGGMGMGLGIGRPPVPVFPKTVGGVPRTKRWLMRRTSSGAFSSGSEAGSRNVTPTRLLAKDWNNYNAVTQQSPLVNTVSLHDPTRSNSTSASNSPVITSPTLEIAAARHTQLQSTSSSSPKKKPSTSINAAAQRVAQARASVFPGAAVRGRMSLSSSEERPGRFEREFVEIDELGRGEFGRVMKARYKEGPSEVFAVKKSKRFEGVKHRLRLREEVDTLKHLSHAAARAGLGLRHPNVLGYIDSWEEDEVLYIQTELCSLGNFSHLLWEYGRTFPRLDEARVWKIFAELSDGLRFIHNSGVIHLDLKPANIFITGEGRFKIGDFGMASIWPRPAPANATSTGERTSFEREGDKLYLAPEVLQGKYSKAADIFSLGMTILETATNIIIPDQGDAWHRIRHENFTQINLSDLSTELVELLKSMLRTDPSLRVDVDHIYTHPVIMRARVSMELARETLGASFQSSALAGAPAGWLESILGYEDGWNGHEDDEAMDLSP